MYNTTQPSGCKQLAIFIVLAFCAGRVSAQPARQPGNPVVGQTSFIEKGDSSQRKTVQFGRQAAHVGDQVTQTLALEMRLTTSTRQGNQVVEKSLLRMCTAQHRVVTTTEVESGRTTAVVVQYVAATKQVAATPQPLSGPSSSDRNDRMPLTNQPVSGKTYRCRRENGDNGKLKITDVAGDSPPSDELEIVAPNMEMVGRGNPLAEFLAGRIIAIGETLRLPQDAADRLLNLGERFGEVNRFELALREIVTVDGVSCAEFRARIDAASNNSSQMRLQMEGPLIVQIDTCRAVRTDLSGPIALSETRGSYSTTSHLFGTGRMNMRIESIYGTAKK